MSEHFRKYVKKEHYPVHPTNIRFKTSFKNCIFEALERRTWKETEHETEWDIYWTEKEWIHEVMDHIHLAPNQRLNHFRNYFELCRKDNLIKNLKRHKKALEKEGKFDEAAEYNFFPTTYNLPGEYSIFCEEFKKNSNNVWIMKPIGKAQGKGIFLFNKLSQVSQWKNDNRWKQDSPQVESYIAQRYINNPLLIGGKKFDMRIYCLVTSYSPLTAYLYRDGFARFTHHRYDSEDITNSYVHLTNVAIQKTSENYDEKLGGKWDLAKLKLYLMSQYGRDAVSESFADIQRVIIRSLQSVQKVMMNDKHCFELYGFDILLDAQLKPWLIEVNGSPSMTANTPQDFELKCGLLDDVFTIIDMERILTGQEEQIGGFDLICKGVPIKNESTLFSTMLGCHNNRGQQLKKLSKMIANKLAQAATQQEKEEAKKAAAKDSSSISTADTISTAPKIKTRIISKVEPATTTAKMSRVPPSFNKQNTMAPMTTSQSQPQPQPSFISKDPKEIREGNQSVSVPRSLPGRPRETGRGKTTVGLPPVNHNGSSTGQISTPISHMGNATPISNTSSNIPQRTPSYPGTLSQVSQGFTAHVNALSSSPIGIKQFNQPMQSQISSTKSPSALQLAGSATLKPDMSPSYESYKRVKGKSMVSMQDSGIDQKQNIYNYDISDLASSKFDDKSDKSEKYTFVRNSEVMASRSEHKKSSIFGGKSENSNSNEEGSSYGKKKEESQESNEKYASSHEEDE